MARGGSSFEVDGLTETLSAFQRLGADLERPAANNELRDAAGTAAEEGVSLLRAAAASAATPVSPRVARSVRVQRDRIPSIFIGGPAAVGRGGAPASVLLWGSEHGGHNFAAGPSSGYWIAPTIKRFRSSRAVEIYRHAVDALIRKYGLD